ncbi:Prolyl 3-hydroxylase sudestada1 [Sergentomyia squamirostris]
MDDDNKSVKDKKSEPDRQQDKEITPDYKMRKQESQFKMNSKYTDDDFTGKFKDSWAKNETFEYDGLILRNCPFKICTVQNFLSDTALIEKLMNEIINEIEWKRLHTDFLEFHQSPDLASVISDHIADIYRFLREEGMPWMQMMTGEKLSHVSASVSLYNTGDRLLIHNDCVSDRKIAYIFYLSPWDSVKTWTESMGGALELFKEEKENYPQFPPVDKIHPKNNQFLFFHVNSKSWHQVGEVLTFDYPRVTINGWFHGPGPKHPIVKSSTTWDDCIVNPPKDAAYALEEWVNEEYLKKNTKIAIQSHIEEHSQISLREFLKPNKLQLILEELQSDQVHFEWENKSSACERNCETLNITHLKSLEQSTKKLMEFVQSECFFNLLHEYTELDLAGKAVKSPKCYIEIQRWKPECYTMLVNPPSGEDEEEQGILDVILYLNEFSEAGTYMYVPNDREKKPTRSNDPSSDCDDEEEEEADDGPLIIHPKSGALNLIYRTTDMARFGAYVSKHLKMGSSYVYILACSYKE